MAQRCRYGDLSTVTECPALHLYCATSFSVAAAAKSEGEWEFENRFRQDKEQPLEQTRSRVLIFGGAEYIFGG